MLYKSNILALVGGGIYPKYSLNKIIIYDDHQGKIISQIRFNSEVIKVKIRKDVIVGVIQDKIYILNIVTLETIDILETYNNPQGVFSLSNNTNDLLIAFPYSKNKGKVLVNNYTINSLSKKKNEEKIINAHDSIIACISMNNDGTILATSSDKGTLIRIFLLSKYEHPVITLKRGTKNAKINCLIFDLSNEIIGCTSDSGTMHVFNICEINKLINDNKKEEKNKEEKNKIKSWKNNIKINMGERSFGKFKINEAQSIFGFYQANRLMVLTSKGNYYRVLYDTKEGCKKLEEGKINI